MIIEQSWSGSYGDGSFDDFEKFFFSKYISLIDWTNGFRIS